MEQRALGRSGLFVSSISFGCMAFGGEGFLAMVGQTQQEEANRLVGLCLDAGVTLFDTADAYSAGKSEEILGRALGANRHRALIATKAFGRMGDGPNDAGTSRYHLVRSCEASLKRLGTDYIDLYQMHGWDSLTPIDETLRALDDLVSAGKVRYVGTSNYGGWQLMKALSRADARGWARPVSQQIYYSAVGRDAEHELVPVGLEEGVGILAWGPMAFGMLSGKFRRGQPDPEGARGKYAGAPGGVDRETIYNVVDVLTEIAEARGATVGQVALNWVRARRGVSSIIVGARNEAQLTDNLAAAAWSLTPEEVARIDAAGDRPLPYPNWFYKNLAQDRTPYYQKG